MLNVAMKSRVHPQRATKITSSKGNKISFLRLPLPLYTYSQIPSSDKIYDRMDSLKNCAIKIIANRKYKNLE